MMVKNWRPLEPLRTKARLDQFILETWNNVSNKNAEILKLARSMPNRLEEVIAQGGHATKY